jgi:hypothetical protein
VFQLKFLLIETSPTWPRSLDWLDPETSNNRCWIRRGSFHILDQSGVEEEGGEEEACADGGGEEGGERESLALDKALQILRLFSGDDGQHVTDNNRTTIRRGDKVKIDGLVSRSDLNGCLATCIGVNNDRLVVEIAKKKNNDNKESSMASSEGQRLKVKPTNLLKVRTTEAPSAVVDAFQSKLTATREAMKVNKQVVKMILPMEIAFIL